MASRFGSQEKDALGGFDPYSNSKSCSELVTMSYRNSFFHPEDYEAHGVGLASARAGNAIGGSDWAKDRLIPDLIRALLRGRKLTIRNPGFWQPLDTLRDKNYLEELWKSGKAEWKK